MQLPLHHRWATPNDDKAMAELVNIAGEGLPFYLWSKSAEDSNAAWAVGRERARREQGSFSYRNTVLREEAGEVVAGLIGYPLDDKITPANYSDMPPMFVPMQELEDLAPATWYLNVLATYPAHQGRGFGGDLLAIAEMLARASKKRGLSIIVADSNYRARRLYERWGYTQRDTRPMVKEQWENPGKEWVLLIKPL